MRVKKIGSRRSRRLDSGDFFEDRRNDAFRGVYFEDVFLDEGFVYWVRNDRGDDPDDADEFDDNTFDLVRAPAEGGPTQRLNREGRSFLHSNGAVQRRRRRRGRLLLLGALRCPRGELRGDLQGRPRAAGVRVGESRPPSGRRPLPMAARARSVRTGA